MLESIFNSVASESISVAFPLFVCFCAYKFGTYLLDRAFHPDTGLATKLTNEACLSLRSVRNDVNDLRKDSEDIKVSIARMADGIELLANQADIDIQDELSHIREKLEG